MTRDGVHQPPGSLSPALAIGPITPGLNGITLKDGSARTLFEVENIALDSGHYAAAILLGGSNGQAGAGGRAWGIGIDVSAATPYRDLSIYKMGGVNGGGGSASAYDFIYPANRGALPPTVLIGNSSITPNAQVQIISTTDGSGNITDTSLANLRIQTALVTGGVPSNQTQPAIVVSNWQSGTDRFRVEADGSVNIYDGGGAGRVGLASSSDKFALGAGAFGQATDTLRIKPTATDATVRVMTTGGGALLVTALNGSFGVTVNTSNASTLSIGTNNAQAILITTNQSVVLGVTAPALAATDGFPYIPATAGVPTGVPTAQAGYVAMRYDTTNHKLWIYDAGWKGVVVA